MEVIGQGGFGVVFDIGDNKVLKAFKVSVNESHELIDRRLMALNDFLSEKKSYEMLNDLFGGNESVIKHFPAYFGEVNVSDYLGVNDIEDYHLFDKGIVIEKLDADCNFRWWSLTDSWWNDDSKKYIKDFLSEPERLSLLNEVEPILALLKAHKIAFNDSDIDMFITKKNGVIEFKLIDFSLCTLMAFSNLLHSNSKFSNEVREFLASGLMANIEYYNNQIPDDLNFSEFIVR